MIAITTESTADLSRQQLTYAGIEIIPVPLSHQGKIYDDQTITPAQLIGLIEATGQPALTIPVTLEACLHTFETVLQRANEVVHVSTSPKISGHYPVALKAAQQFGGRVQVLNSNSVSYALGLQALHAAHLAGEGAAVEDITAALYNLYRRQLFTFSVHRLDFLRINGRVGNVRAALGNLLGIKPVLNIADSVIQGTANPRGSSAAMQNMVEQTYKFAQQVGEPIQLHFLSTVDGQAQAAVFRELLLSHFPTAAQFDSPIHDVGCGINANLGKGAFSVVAMPASVKLPQGIEWF